MGEWTYERWCIRERDLSREYWASAPPPGDREAARGCRDERKDFRQLERFRDRNSILRAHRTSDHTRYEGERKKLTRECRVRFEIEEFSEFVERTSVPIVSSGADSEYVDNLHDRRSPSSLERPSDVVGSPRENLAKIAVIVHSSLRIPCESRNRSSRRRVTSFGAGETLHDRLEIVRDVFVRLLVRDVFFECRRDPRFVLLRDRRVPVKPVSKIRIEEKEQSAPSIQTIEFDRYSVSSPARNTADDLLDVGRWDERE